VTGKFTTRRHAMSLTIDEPLVAAFVKSITLRITINRTQWYSYNCTINDDWFDVFDCFVGVGLPLVDVLSCCSSTIDLYDRANLINLLFYCLKRVRRGIVESVFASSIRISFVAHVYGFMWKVIAHGLLRDDPTKNSTAIVHGKWPSNAPGHAEHR
jgi:hypothetical protein